MRTKLLLRWLGCFAICFLVVYLLAFASGHKLFENGNSALIGASVALMLSALTFGATERYIALKAKIKDLEDRIAKLEKK